MNTSHIPGLLFERFDGLHHMLSDESVAFMTDDHLIELPAVERLLAGWPGVESIVIPVGEPTTEGVDSVARALAASRVDTIVAFGGGSVLDTAKLSSVTAVSGRPCGEHLGVIERIDRSLEVVAVPTTSGSGAEVTRTSVVSRNGRKSWAWSDRLRPRRVLVDPELTWGLPTAVTISTGLDALVHALEASTSPVEDPAAVASGSAAIEVILEALPAVVADGTNRTARAEMLDAALCAGFAIDRAGTGIGHAVGHALASMVAVPHGVAVAFGMWSCLEWGMEDAMERYQRIDEGGRLIGRLGGMLETIGFERELQRWLSGPLDPVAFETELAREEHRPMCLNNARPVGGEDMETVSRLVSAAWNAMLA